MRDCLILIPAFNEEANIGLVLAKIPSHIDVVVINDGSTDATVHACQAANVNVVSHFKNMGYEAALVTGVEYFLKKGYARFAVLDADGEIHATDAIQILLNVSEKQPIVCGYRQSGIGRVSEKFVGYFSDVLFGIKDVYCGCKAFHLSVVSSHGPKSLCEGIFIKCVLTEAKKIRIVNMPVGGTKRVGRSKFGDGLAVNSKIIFNFIKILAWLCFNSFKCKIKSK